VNMKALLHHSPTEEDISHLLKEFTLDFLLKGYSTLVVELCNHLLHNKVTDGSMDTSHFFWLVTYFLKFSAQLELDLEHVRPVLSFDVLSYLVYEAVNVCEHFELTHAHLGDITPCLRRMHLIVTAVREFLQAVNTYKKMNHLTPQDMEHIKNLQRQVCETEELRCLFVLLIRQFTPTVHSRQYLKDLVITNHLLLSFIESNSLPDQKMSLQTHMKHFVSADMMRVFGFLLESYQENGQFINDCIFTMMHHVAGDLDHVTALFQPSILKAFSAISETDFQICDDWSDLIEYVMHKFINVPQSSPMAQEKEGSEIQASLNKPEGWSQEECDCLYWYYIQSAQSDDPLSAIISLYAQVGTFNKTRIGVIEQLLKQDVISISQYNELLENEPIIDGATKETQKELTESHVFDEIELLKEHLLKEEKLEFVMWIQKLLLEACYAKLRNKIQCCHVVEPVINYYTLLQEPIPVVAWSCDQCNIMKHQPFVLLLHKLGFHLPADTGRLFARIPHFWGPDELYNLACKLGPIQQEWVKFDLNEVSLHAEETVGDNHSFTSGIEHSPPFISTTPKPYLIQEYPTHVPSLSFI